MVVTVRWRLEPPPRVDLNERGERLAERERVQSEMSGLEVRVQIMCAYACACERDRRVVAPKVNTSGFRRRPGRRVVVRML